MPAGYSKEFLVNAALHRFKCLGEANVAELRVMFEPFYDKVGKDAFRKYTSLDADAIKKYKNESDDR